MQNAIAANGTYVFARLAKHLQTGEPFAFFSGSMNYCGNILGISREDGSGRNYNLDFYENGRRFQVFVRCER